MTNDNQTTSASRLGAIALKILPWCFFALFATEIIVVFGPKSDKAGFKTREFGALPVSVQWSYSALRFRWPQFPAPNPQHQRRPAGIRYE